MAFSFVSILCIFSRFVSIFLNYLNRDYSHEFTCILLYTIFNENKSKDNKSSSKNCNRSTNNTDTSTRTKTITKRVWTAFLAANTNVENKQFIDIHFQYTKLFELRCFGRFLSLSLLFAFICASRVCGFTPNKI